MAMSYRSLIRFMWVGDIQLLFMNATGLAQGIIDERST